MARSGIYKSEVLRARDKLYALGRYPSIDAVRVELGNTGSKATIHRYLKEIEEEEGATTGTKVAVSEALQDLVARLAARLNEEAETRIAEVANRHTAEVAQLRSSEKSLRTEIDNLRSLLEQTQVGLAEEQANHRQTAEQLREQALHHTRSAQQVDDLQERLEAEAQHRQSLEEKHQHAREALEHFRASAKEQREHELRQHEQQVQYLQGEVKTLNQTLTQKLQEAIHSNQENARLTVKLARAETSLHEARAELRAQEGLGERLMSAQQQTENLGRRVVELEGSLRNMAARASDLEKKVSDDAAQIQRLEIDLAAARAIGTAQEQIVQDIQVWLSKCQQPINPDPGNRNHSGGGEGRGKGHAGKR